ncbi:VCBS protein [gamma proteobacterium NOR5-3]|nr:VCBS protein [gamma proteobacterium NOR5-3]
MNESVNNRRLRRRGPRLERLEQRLMFDGAVAETTADAAELLPADDHSQNAADTAADATPLGVAPTGDESRSELVVVDGAIENVEALLGQIPEGFDVVVVAPGADGAAAILDALSGRDELDALHIIGHGSDGVQRIGTTVLSAATLGDNQALLSMIEQSLDEQGDVLLYGCYVGTTDGQLFVDQLAALSSADVAASTDATGNPEQGGDWELEYTRGGIETQSVFEGAVESFDGLLAEAVVSGPATVQIPEDASQSLSELAGAETFVITGDTTYGIDVVFALGSGTLENGGLSLDSGSGASFRTSGSAEDLTTYLNGFVYTPAADSNEDAQIVVRLDQDVTENSADNADWETVFTIVIQVTPEADAPVLSGNASLPAIDEDTSDPAGASVSALFAGLFSDVDGESLEGIAISGDASVAGEGVWEYSLDSGTTWTAIGAVSSGSALYLNSATVLRFKPAENFNGTPGELTVRAIDSSTDKEFSEVGSIRSGDLAGADVSAVGRFLSTSVNALNDAPTTSVFDLSVVKNTTLSAIDLTQNTVDVDGGTDNATDAGIVSYSVTVLPAANGGELQIADGTAVVAGSTLTLSQAASLRFVPVENFTGDVTFSFTATDAAGELSNVSVATITVETFNEPPAVNVPGAQAAVEDTPLAIAGISVSDLDAGGDDVQVTIGASAGGSISIANLSGLALVGATANGGSTVSVQGSISNINSALTGLSYQAAPNNTGSETITVTVDDLFDVANSGNKTASDTIAVTISPVADRPEFSGDATLAPVDEDTADPLGQTVATILTGVYLDADGDPLAGIAVTADASDPADGVWQYSLDNGVNWDPVGAVTESEALFLDASTRLRFLPVANWNGVPGGLTVFALDSSGSRSFTNASRVTDTVAVAADDLSAIVTDGAVVGGSALLGTSITAVDDPFVVVNDATATVQEGGTTAITSANLRLSDVEATLPEQIVYTLTGLPTTAGSLLKGASELAVTDTFTQQDINDGLLSFVHNGSEPSATGASLSIAYTASEDQGGSSSDRTLTINVSQVNDAPTLSSTPVLVNQGGSVAVDTTFLTIADSDNIPAQLIIRLDALPAHGTLTLNGAPVIATDKGVDPIEPGTTFSAADIASGALVYEHDGSTDFGDSFAVSIRDGAGGIVGADTPLQIAINITEVNTAPLITGDVVVELNEDQAGLSVFSGVSFTDAQTDNAALVITIDSLPDPANALLFFNDVQVTQAQVDAGFRFAAADKNSLTVDHVSAGNQRDPSDASFQISVRDDGSPALTSSETITIDLKAINDAPIGTAGSQEILAGQTVVIDASLLNATDVDALPDGSELTFNLETRPARGFLFLDGIPLGEDSIFTQADLNAGILSYRHDGTADGDDSFTVTVRDGSGGVYLDGIETPLTVSFDVVPPPTYSASDDSFDLIGVSSRVFTAADLFGNDTGTGTITLTSVSAVDPVGAGTVELTDAGSTVTFTVADGYTGPAEFTYTAEDSIGSSDTATVTLDITAIDAVGDTVVTQKDTAVDITEAELIANDQGSGTLNITSVSDAVNGSVALVGDTITFTPAPGFFGNASFKYTVENATGSDTALVTVSVEPFAINDSYTEVLEREPVLTGGDALLANDRGANLRIVSVGSAVNGSLSFDTINGAITNLVFTPGHVEDSPGYVPQPLAGDETGSASFVYTVEDENGNQATATASFALINLIARDNGFSTESDTPLVISALSTILLDNDEGNDSITVVAIDTGGSPGEYSVVWDEAGDTLTVTPDPGFSGDIAIEYTLRDGDGEEDIGLITVNVESAPTVAAIDDAFSTAKDTALVLEEGFLLANDDGSEGLSVTSVTEPAVAGSYAVVWDEAGDAITVTPTNGFTGPVVFSYTAQDSEGNSYTADVTVTVLDDGVTPTDPPVAANDLFVVNEDTPGVFTAEQLLANDGVNTPLTIQSVQDAVNGSVQLIGTTVTFTPAEDFNGTASFTYTITDSSGSGLSDTATVEVVALAVNDAPLIVEGTQTGFNEGARVTVSSDALDTVDPDNPAAELIYTITDFGAGFPGVLSFEETPGGGLTALELNDTFTQADLDSGKIKFDHDGGETHTATFTVRVTDGSAFFDVGTATLQDTPVNDRPQITGRAVNDLGRPLVKEGESVVIRSTDITSRDRDRGVDGNLTDTLLLSISTLPSFGALFLDTNDDGTFDTEVTTSTTFTQAQINAGRLQYLSDGDAEVTADVFTVQVDDQSGAANATSSADVNIGIIAVNDDPVTVAAEGDVRVYEGAQIAVNLNTLFEASDVENDDDQVQFRITQAPSSGQLILLDAPGADSGVVIGVNSAFTREQVLANQIVYRHDGTEVLVETPVDLRDDFFAFIVSDAGGGAEPAGTINIFVDPVNDAPTLAVPSGLSVNEQATLNVTGVSIGDPDAVDPAGNPLADFASVTPMVVELFSNEGVISVTASDGSDTDAGLAAVSGAGSAGDPLTLSGSLADINATLATLRFTGNTNFSGTATVDVTVRDGGNTGADPDDPALAAVDFSPEPVSGGDNNAAFEQARSTFTIAVNAVNDAPTIVVPAQQTVSEDPATALVFSGGTSNAITVADPDVADGGAYIADVTVSVLNGTLSMTASGAAQLNDNATDSVSISGSIDDINATLEGLQYTPDADYYNDAGNPDTLTITIADNSNFGVGGEKSAIATVDIVVTPVNDAPTTSAPTIGAVSENDSGNNVNFVTFALPSSDVSASGVTDSELVTQFIIVSVPPASEGVLAYIADDGGAVTAIAANALLSKNEAQSITFTPEGDFNGTVSFSFLAEDVGGLRSGGESNIPQVGTITVLGVNDTPVLAGFDDADVPYSEGAGAGVAGTPVRLDANGNMQLLSDIELTERLEDSFTSSTLTVTRAGWTGAGSSALDRFGLDETYSADVYSVSIAGSNLQIEGGDFTDLTTIASVTSDSQSNGRYQIRFDESAAVAGVLSTATDAERAEAFRAAVSAVMTRLTFSSEDDVLEGELGINITFNDGNTGAQGSGNRSATGSVTVDVSRVNDSPEFTDDQTVAAVAEDTGIANPGQTVASLFDSLFADPDNASSDIDALGGVAIIGTAANGAEQGEWQYSINSGADWIAVPAVSEDAALFLDTAALVRFVSVDNANNNTFANDAALPSLTVKAVDSTTALASGASAVDASGGGVSPIAAESVQLFANVSPINDTPTFSDLDGDSVNFTEGALDAQGAAILLDQSANGALADIDVTVNAEANFDGATLTVSDITTNGNGTPVGEDFFFILNNANGISISGIAQTVAGESIFRADGSSINYNGTSVASISDNSATSGQLVLTFNADATVEAVNAIIQNVSFNSASSSVEAGVKEITFVFDDAGAAGADPGISGTASSEIASAQVTIKIIPTNDAPLLTAGELIAEVEAVNGSAVPTVQTVGELLSDKLVDPDNAAGEFGVPTLLAGVAVSAFDDQGLGAWEVDLDGGDDSWVTLESLQGAGLSESNALLLAVGAQIRFVPTDGNVNTFAAVNLPSLTVFGVEDRGPNPDVEVNPFVVIPTVFSTTGDVRFFDTSTDDATSVVTAAPVSIDLSIAAQNDSPVLAATANPIALTESDVQGIGTESALLLNAGVSLSDIDLTTTAGLLATNFGAGVVQAGWATGVDYDAGDVFGLAADVASPAAGDARDNSGTIEVYNGSSWDAVGTVDPGQSGAGEALQINLLADVSITQVESVLAALRFENTSDNPSLAAEDVNGRNFEVRVADGNNEDAEADTAGGPGTLFSTAISGNVRITDQDDAPIITGGPDVADLEETDLALTATGQFTVEDVNTTDVVTATPTLLVSGSSDRADPAAPDDTALLNMLSLSPSPILDNATSIQDVTWTFDSGAITFDYLDVGQTLVLTYTVTASDSFLSDSETITITITGTNDTPVIAVEAGDSDAELLTESDIALSTSGTLSVEDLDTTDTVSVSVNGLAVSGSFGGTLPTGLSASSNAALVAMLSVDSGTIIDGASTTGTINWAFASTPEVFDFLATDETLILSYTVRATDDSGLASASGNDEVGFVDKTVTITITGTNDAPIVAAITQADLTEQSDASALATTLTANFGDVDLTDVGHTATITAATAAGVVSGLPVDLGARQTALAALITPVPVKASDSASGSVALNFSAASTVFDYLQQAEVVTLNYTVEVDDGDGGTDSEDFVITVTGTNDAPLIIVEDLAGAITELVTPTGNLTDSGVLTFTDVDLADVHVVSATGTAVTADPLGALTAVLDTDTTGTGAGGQLTWTYTVAASAVEYLQEGEERVESFTITLDDQQGSVLTRQVDVTITGTNDAPVIAVIAQTNLNEQTDTAPLTADIAIPFTDVDLADVGHSAAITAVAVAGDVDGLPAAGAARDAVLEGLVTLGSVTKNAGDGTGTLTAAFSAASTVFNYLQTGEVVTVTYTVEVDDQTRRVLRRRPLRADYGYERCAYAGDWPGKCCGVG